MATTAATTKQLILNLQDAGITNEYVNVLLESIQEDKDDVFKQGELIGKEKARGTFMAKLNSSDNFNTQYLKNWLKRVEL